MTRDEWYNSKKFKILRLLNHLTHDITHRAQEIRDVLEIILEEHPDLIVFDKFTLVERQLRVLQLEGRNLVSVASDLSRKLEPHTFDDLKMPQTETEPPEPEVPWNPITHPDEVDWIEGDLPDVASVHYKCVVLCWMVTDEGKLGNIMMAVPHKDKLNPLKWCDTSGFPLGNFGKVKYWAWVHNPDDQR